MERFGYDKVEEARRIERHCPICAALALLSEYKGLDAIAISAEMKDEEVRTILGSTIYKTGYTVYISGNKVRCIRGVDCPGNTVVLYVVGYTKRGKERWIRGDIILERHVAPD